MENFCGLPVVEPDYDILCYGADIHPLFAGDDRPPAGQFFNRLIDYGLPGNEAALNELLKGDITDFLQRVNAVNNMIASRVGARVVTHEWVVIEIEDADIAKSIRGESRKYRIKPTNFAPGFLHADRILRERYELPITHFLGARTLSLDEVGLRTESQPVSTGVMSLIDSALKELCASYNFSNTFDTYYHPEDFGFIASRQFTTPALISGEGQITSLEALQSRGLTLVDIEPMFAAVGNIRQMLLKAGVLSDMDK